MGKRIDFWREVQNSYGSTYHAVLKTYVAPDNVPDTEALSKAIHDFCDWAHVSRWNDLASGYDIDHIGDGDPPHQEWHPISTH